MWWQSTMLSLKGFAHVSFLFFIIISFKKTRKDSEISVKKLPGLGRCQSRRFESQYLATVRTILNRSLFSSRNWSRYQQSRSDWWLRKEMKGVRPTRLAINTSFPYFSINFLFTVAPVGGYESRLVSSRRVNWHWSLLSPKYWKIVLKFYAMD